MLNFARKMKIAPAKIVSQRSYLVSGKLKITEHFFDVPKDYSKPEGSTIRVFGRSIRKHETPIVPDASPEKTQLPLMVYLQGGPGQSCSSPQNFPFAHTVIDKGYEMFFLDQRGTGLSTPVTASTLQMRGTTEVQAAYLHYYRADSIIRDCEAIRKVLTAEYPDEKKKWSTMGQSFGGFCTLTYLSMHPEGLRESFVFGGLAPITQKNPDEVYRRCYRKIVERNEAYYRKYPEDIAKVKLIMNYLSRFGDGKIKLPSEGNLTRRRFRQLGLMFGGHGGLDAVHDLVLRASSDVEAFGHLTRGSLSAIERAVPFDDVLIYAILHEPIYCQGGAANWSAERIMSEFPQFDLTKTAPADSSEPILFTGETIYPWMFEDYSELRKVQDVANIVAADSSWPALYDLDQLARNEVPVYAAAYAEDMYVDFDFSMETAKKVRACKVFTTNVLFHDAIRSRMDEVVKQAFALRDDVVD